MKHKSDNFQKNKYFVGHQIRAQFVLCIDKDNKNLGVISVSEALKNAIANGLDLVQINDGKTPTCKILDYNKFKYEMSKQDKLSRKKQRESASKVKEIKFRPATDDNDLKTKAKQAAEFIEEGHKVKITIVFKGREISYKNLAEETLNKFLSLLPDMELISSPSLNGKALCVMAAKKNAKIKLENAS